MTIPSGWNTRLLIEDDFIFFYNTPPMGFPLFFQEMSRICSYLSDMI
jgi:hypothetical protein